MGDNSSGAFDKNKVMNVKPLRCLVPMFSSPPGVSSSSSPQTAPFVCAPPTGPFPPGFSSFYPFVFSQSPNEHSHEIPAPVPLSSFKTPPANGDSGPSRRRSRLILDQNGDSYSESQDQNGDGGVKGSKKKGRRVGNPESSAEVDAVASSLISSFHFSSDRIANGDIETVRYILMIMNFLRRRIAQIEGCKEATQRPDLRAAAILMNRGIRTNMSKRVGVVPGVEIGDIFYFRMELCLVGLHAPSMGGIDYMTLKSNEDQIDEPVAVSIVSSGGYEDNNEDTDVIIYSGQGGKDKFMDVADQKLERGNLALEKSLHRGNEIRVIRGLRDVTTVSGKIYLYDGLYKIRESWIEKNKSGFNIFKYKLVRLPGQPQGFALWNAIQQWKDDVTSRPGVILPDLSSSGEILPVSLVNEVDDDKGPAYFTYFPGLKYPRPINLSGASTCSCQAACQMGDPNCPCVQRNGGSLLYNALGALMTFRSVIHECGSSCPCPATCRNRVTQAGLKVRLEVFKTRDKGWGLRSLDPIRSGTFICEYAGEVIEKSTGEHNDDNFIFDATRRYEPHEIMVEDSDESSKLPYPLVISAKNIGNIARFMNHSCSPSVYWQPVMRERGNGSYLHIVFFAINNIAPMRELTFDYGTIVSGNAEHRMKKCMCGSLNCRGYFY